MASEDIIQINSFKYVDFVTAGSPGVMVINAQAGFGIFTHNGTSRYRLTAVPGAKPSFDLKRLSILFTPKDANGFRPLAVDLDILNSTSTVLELVFSDGAGVSDASGTLVFSEIENFRKGG